MRAHLGVPLAFALALCACRRERELVYVSTEAGNQVVVVDPGRGEVVARIAVGKRPRGLRLSRDAKLLFVAESGSPRAGPNVDESSLPPADRKADGIGVVDLATQKLVRSLPGGQDPESFDLSLDGKRLYVSNEETAQLSVVDVDKATVVKQVPVGREPEGVSLHPDGKRVYVTSEEDGLVVAVDTTTLAEVARVETGKRPRAIAFSADGKLGYVTNELSGTLAVIDLAQNRVLASLAIEARASGTEARSRASGTEARGPSGTEARARPMGVVLSRDGKQLFVSTGRGGSVAVIDLGKPAVARIFANVGARPWGIGLSRDGKRLYTANGPSNDVSIIDVASGKVQKRVAVGGLPWGIAVR